MFSWTCRCGFHASNPEQKADHERTCVPPSTWECNCCGNILPVDEIRRHVPCRNGPKNEMMLPRAQALAFFLAITDY